MKCLHTFLPREKKRKRYALLRAVSTVRTFVRLKIQNFGISKSNPNNRNFDRGFFSFFVFLDGKMKKYGPRFFFIFQLDFAVFRWILPSAENTAEKRKGHKWLD